MHWTDMEIHACMAGMATNPLKKHGIGIEIHVWLRHWNPCMVEALESIHRTLMIGNLFMEQARKSKHGTGREGVMLEFYVSPAVYHIRLPTIFWP